MAWAFSVFVELEPFISHSEVKAFFSEQQSLRGVNFYYQGEPSNNIHCHLYLKACLSDEVLAFEPRMRQVIQSFSEDCVRVALFCDELNEALCNHDELDVRLVPGLDKNLLFPLLMKEVIRAKEYFQTRGELAQATEIALLSMTASSHLGEVIDFLKSSFCSQDYNSLAVELMETLSALGVSGTLEIVDEDDGRSELFGGERGIADQSWLKHRNWEKRIQVYEGKLILNYKMISMLVDDLPLHNEEELGRLRDALAILIEGVFARVQWLKAEEKAKAAQVAKNQFLATMSHELRTPLNSILGFAKLLNRRVEGDAFNKRDISSLKSISDNAVQLTEMVEAILDLSALFSGNLNVSTQRLDVAGLLKATLDKHQTAANNKQLEFSVSSPESLLAEVDVVRFTQVVNSLLSNAVKFTEKGSVYFGLSAETISDVDCVKLIVRDTGIGIPDSEHKKVFQFFTQADQSTKRYYSGAGMGLAMAAELVKMHHGDIKMRSEVGVGSEFEVLIPRYAKKSEKKVA
jgi:signal transduction histidine kinase